MTRKTLVRLTNKSSPNDLDNNCLTKLDIRKLNKHAIQCKLVFEVYALVRIHAIIQLKYSPYSEKAEVLISERIETNQDIQSFVSTISDKPGKHSSF